MFAPHFPGDKKLNILARIGRVVVRGAIVGAPDRRDPLQRYRRAGRRLRCGGEQAHLADTQHVSRAMEGADGR